MILLKYWKGWSKDWERLTQALKTATRFAHIIRVTSLSGVPVLQYMTRNRLLSSLSILYLQMTKLMMSSAPKGSSWHKTCRCICYNMREYGATQDRCYVCVCLSMIRPEDKTNGSHYCASVLPVIHEAFPKILDEVRINSWWMMAMVRAFLQNNRMN